MNRTSTAPLLLLAALLAGCSPGPTVLARIGDRTITTDEFLDVARRNRSQYPGPPEAARTALLEDLVKRERLVIEARRRGLVSAEEQARLLRQTGEQLAFRALLERMAPRDVPVSDAEVEALYRQRGSEAHVQVVFTPDRTAIEQALLEIRQGADFGATADRFNTTGMAPPHGDLGFVTAGSLVAPLDQYVSEGPVGKVIGPLESPGAGWFLIKVLERRPRKQEPFEQTRQMLRAALQQRKQRVLLNRVQHELLAQYRVRVEPGAPQILFRRYNAPKDTMRVAGSPLPVPAPLTPEEARQVLVRYDGEDGRTAAYSLGDAVQDLKNPAQLHPDFTMTPIIEQWLQSTVLQRVALIEARRRHLEEEPAVARQARERVNNALLEAAYQALVLAPTTVTEDDVRAYFERYAAHSVRLQSARLRLASFPDSGTATRVVIAAAQAGSLEEGARKSGGGARVVEMPVRFPTSDPLWNRLESALTSMKAGEVSGVVRTERGWLVFQVVSKEEAPQDYATLDPGARQALQSEALEMKREQRLAELTDSLRRQYRPVIYRERLARVSWPAGPPEPGA